MTVYLNKQSIETDSPESLATFLGRNGVPMVGIAVAVDRKLVPRDKWSEFMLADGMEIIVVNATCGG